MKGIYIYYKLIDEKKANGIEKKVVNQIQLFNNSGAKCEMVVFPHVDTLGAKILSRLPFTNVDPVWTYNKKYKEIDYIYFRRPFYMDRGMRKFLKTVRKENPNIKIIMEIPTYPYDKELMTGILNLPLYIKDCYNRKKLSGLVDVLAVIGDIEQGERLWGIDTISFINGVDVDQICKKKNCHIENEINIICVSTCEFWHGFDRLFVGLKNYYDENGEKIINIHIVGNGSEKEKYEKLVKQYGIQDRVKFYGMLYGEDLNAVYDKCDLACASLGLHRIGVKNGSFLKTREYLAKGMPMLLGSKIDVISDGYRYSMEFAADDTAIDMKEVVAFYNMIYHGNETREEVAENIRNYAKQKVDLSVTMKDIVEYIMSK